MAAPACLIVCAGKDCRGSKGFDALAEVASEERGSLQAPCQGLCHGPIVGVRIRGEVRWFDRIRNSKEREALVKAVRREHIGDRLGDHEVRSRRGELKHSGRLQPLTPKSRRKLRAA